MEVKALSNLFKRQLDCRTCRSGRDIPTGMQGMIIHFLVEHEGKRDVFQRDLETVFSMRRSTATGVLQLMEKNGLILRQSVEHDARLKRILLTPKAMQFHEMVTQQIREVETLAVKDLSDDELEFFFRITEKIRNNLS